MVQILNPTGALPLCHKVREVSHCQVAPKSTYHWWNKRWAQEDLKRYTQMFDSFYRYTTMSLPQSWLSLDLIQWTPQVLACPESIPLFLVAASLFWDWEAKAPTTTTVSPCGWVRLTCPPPHVFNSKSRASPSFIQSISLFFPSSESDWCRNSQWILLVLRSSFG